MTNAQIWVSAFLVLFIALFVLSRITKEDEQYIEEDYYQQSESFGQESGETDALALINRIGCVSCHGVDLKGTNLGPSLYSANQYWSRERLISYLRNPASFSGDSRFEAYKEKYKSIMPPYNNIDVKQLGIMADYLLQLREE